PLDQGRNVGKAHGGEMGAAKLFTLCEQLIEMAPPTGWIGRALLDMSFGASRIQDGLDSSTKPRRCYGLAMPERLQHREHVLGSDLVDGLRPNRAGILGQGLPPLVTMLLIAPALLQLVDQLIGATPERGDAAL